MRTIEHSNSLLRAIIAGHEGVMEEAASLIEELHGKNKHGWLDCKSCNVIKRLRQDRTGLYGDD